MYEADDGEKFDNKESCERHEVLIARLINANECFKNGATLYRALELLNDNMDNFSIEDKIILMKITKDTGISVPHWQCRDNQGYKPCSLNIDGKVYLFGDSGSWSGPYGEWVKINDLLRYFRNHNG
jgi:hypothetical protein